MGKTRKLKVLEKLAGQEKEKRFVPFYFRVHAFSVQRTRLSRSLKQANWYTAQGSLTVLGSIFAVCAADLSVPLPHYSLFLSQLWTPSWSFLDKCNFAIPTYS